VLEIAEREGIERGVFSVGDSDRDWGRHVSQDSEKGSRGVWWSLDLGRISPIENRHPLWQGQSTWNPRTQAGACVYQR
jgi:hypothetical protein